MPADLLRALRESRARGAFGEALTLARRLRPRWAELLADAGNKGGRGAARALLRSLFRLGLFDEPPLSGEPYAAWRMWRALAGDASVPSPEPADAAEPAEPSDAADVPFFSLIMPVYDPLPAYLEAALDSLRAQTFAGWELCAADDASPDPRIREILLRRATQDKRIRPFFRAENGHISAASNTALDMARGTWCVLLDHDDVLPPEALARVAAALRDDPSALVLFSDEDRLEEDGMYPDGKAVCRFTSPLFKHGFDPDLFLACNVVSHLGVYRTDMLRGQGGFRPGMEGGQDYDLALRVLAEYGPSVFRHVPEVLYHWRRHSGSTSSGIEAKPYARDAALRARRSYAARYAAQNPGNGGARFRPRPGSGFVDVSFVLPDDPPRLSLIVFAEAGISSSQEKAILAAWDARAAVRNYPGTELLAVRDKADGSAAFVRSCNALAREAQGGVLAFVRAGDETAGPDWARLAVAALLRPDVGVAGCRTLGSQGFLLQAGYALSGPSLSLGAAPFGQNIVRPGADGGASFWLCPAYAGLHHKSPGYYSQAHLLRSVPAVYLSGLFVRRELFAGLGGLRPDAGELAAADFCLRAWFEEALRSIVVPGADLLSQTAVPPCAASMFFARAWGERLAEGVPFQSPNLDWTTGGWRLRPDGRSRGEGSGGRN